MGSEVIFSLVDGYVWACWPGTAASVRLGVDDAVIEGMQGFLAQCALGERLANSEYSGNQPNSLGEGSH